MLHEFHIVHRLKPGVFTTDQFPVWATCLRSLAFTNAICGMGDEIFTQGSAYRFLLEVVCGLKSPIVGETEVFGQFKVFAQEWIKAEPGRRGLVQRVLSDAKAIRTEHLSSLGNQSYGSWVRSNLSEQRVHFLGAGQMVREIMPYLIKQKREVIVHLRDPRKAINLSVENFPLEARAFDRGALIVAAPLGASEISQWLDGQKPQQVIDLRDNSALDRLPAFPFTRTHLLRDIFTEIERTKFALTPRLEKVYREIQACSEKASAHALMRPQGWDDLCA